MDWLLLDQCVSISDCQDMILGAKMLRMGWYGCCHTQCQVTDRQTKSASHDEFVRIEDPAAKIIRIIE